MDHPTPQETSQKLPAARRGRGRPRLEEPSRLVKVMAPGALVRRLEEVLTTSTARREALIEAIEIIIASHEPAQDQVTL